MLPPALAPPVARPDVPPVAVLPALAPPVARTEAPPVATLPPVPAPPEAPPVAMLPPALAPPVARAEVPPVALDVPPVLAAPPAPTPPVDELAPPVAPDGVELAVPPVSAAVVGESELPEQAMASGLKIMRRAGTILLTGGRIETPLGELLSARHDIGCPVGQCSCVMQSIKENFTGRRDGGPFDLLSGRLLLRAPLRGEPAPDFPACIHDQAHPQRATPTWHVYP